MKRIRVLAVAVTVLVALAGVAWAADNDSHTVTVQVNAVNELAISGGNLTLTISSATAGSDLDDATDNTTCDLAWTTNQATRKITVVTDLGSPTFTLKVVAQNVAGGGSAASEVTLSTTAADLVTGVSQSSGGCDLAYTASATAAQGTGSDVHTVTYTVTAA